MADGEPIMGLWEEISFSVILIVVLAPWVELPSLFWDMLVLVALMVEKIEADVKS